MALIDCYECGKEISSTATACPHCGAPARQQAEQPVQDEGSVKRVLKGVAWGATGLAALLWFASKAPSGTTPDTTPPPDNPIPTWQDVNYARTLPSGALYCTSQGNLEKIHAYAQDGAEGGAGRMFKEGKCSVSSGMKIEVFMERGSMVNFLSPSGKTFYTFKLFFE